ncbi:MAG: exodeoxyribonuclease VII large subunit [Acidaminococcaceae bacterium]|nr:exodeoxyribonuclease VII large subunit [Acidaminococcaceae bacterium]
MAEVHTYTVTEMNHLIKKLVEGSGQVAHVQVRGEISNFKRYPSGHCYFSLKDAGSVLKCVMFQRQARQLLRYPNNGDTVVAIGSISVYEPNGVYQLYADMLIEEGIGSLMQAYEKLKKKLEEEGLFSEERKKMLPAHPKTVGIITSPAGAAVRDVIKVARRRDPGVKLLLYPVQVQGKTAAGDIAHAIRFMNKHRLADVLIVGRGGGSMEDLWAFNEEIAVRAVAASEIPVISAVGHETDFTLSDFAADKRAATPSQAAELAVEDTRQLRRQVLDRQARLEIAINHMLQQRTETLRRLMKSRMLQDPLRITDRAAERLDMVLMRMQQTLPRRLENRELRLMQAMKTLQHPEKLLLEPERRLQQSLKTLQHPERLLVKPDQRVAAALKALYKQKKLWEPYENRYQNAWNQFTALAKNLTLSQEQRLSLATGHLDAVSPLKILSRGYSVTTNGQGHIVKSAQDVHWGEEIRTRLCDGDVYSVIQQIDFDDTNA